MLACVNYLYLILGPKERLHVEEELAKAEEQSEISLLLPPARALSSVEARHELRKQAQIVRKNYTSLLCFCLE